METQKIDYNDKDQALEILKRFKKKYLHNNIEELKDFSFWYILTDEEFNGVSFDGNKFDGDRTTIVYAIDKLLYDEKKIPNFTLGPKGNYTGDTINTFRTLFGNRFIGSEQVFEKDFLNNDYNNIQIKNDFFKTYQKIGNFYILPTGKSKILKQSINKYRGTNYNYKDFFDVFLNNLYTNNDKFLSSLKKEEINNEFFNIIRDLKSFRDLFYLEDYENLNFNHPETKNGSKCNLRYFKALDIDKAKYIDFAFDYIKKATELINKRSAKIVGVLKSKYPELIQ